MIGYEEGPLMGEQCPLKVKSANGCFVCKYFSAGFLGGSRGCSSFKNTDKCTYGKKESSMIKKGDKIKVKWPFEFIGEEFLSDFEVKRIKECIYNNKRIVEAEKDEVANESTGNLVLVSYISYEEGDPTKYITIKTKYLEKVLPKVKYKDVKTGELKEGCLIGEPIKQGWDTLVKVQASSGLQETVLVNSKHVYPLLGDCDNDEFKEVMGIMADIHNKKNEMIEDSNNQESIKNDFQDDKLRWDLLPLEEIEDIVKVYHAGAKKYGPNRWQNLEDGFQRYKAAALRHLLEYEKGERVDADTGCLHLAQFAWNAIAMLYLDKHGKGIIKN